MPPYTMRIQPSRHTYNYKFWRERNEVKPKPKPESKYKFSRVWHEVGLPFSGLENGFENNPRLLWCTEQFGPRPDRPDAWCRWYVWGLTIRFRDQQDYMLYLLRWGRD